jgi:hypothetical protein
MQVFSCVSVSGSSARLHGSTQRHRLRLLLLACLWKWWGGQGKQRGVREFSLLPV